MNKQMYNLILKTSHVMNNFFRNLLLFLLLFLIATPLVHGNLHSQEEDKLLFEQVFNEWTKAFNQKDLAKTCALFSKNLNSTYYNIPNKNNFAILENNNNNANTNNDPNNNSSNKNKNAEHAIKNNDYNSICNGFKKIFAEENKRYQYRFEIHKVYRSVDLAAIRITWYLTVDEPGKKTALTQDEGLDILEQDEDKQWKIVHFLSFGGS